MAKEKSIMTNRGATRSPRVIVPRPERVRHLGPSGFGWLDARLHQEGWLGVLAPEEISTYAFLCLVADKQGVSWYRRDRMLQAMAVREDLLWHSLDRLYSLDLVAYRPFGEHASEGFRQVMSIPPKGPSQR